MRILATDEIGKSYRGRRVVNGVSLRVEQGEVVGLLGPNGAGKTTTFYAIVGLVPPDTGRVLYDGQDITDVPMYLRARQYGISYLPQEASVFRKLTVEENILAVLEAQPISWHERREKMETLIDQLGLEYIRQNRGFALSGGERRRVEIARCLCINPTFILLDEPFSGMILSPFSTCKRSSVDCGRAESEYWLPTITCGRHSRSPTGHTLLTMAESSATVRPLS